MMGIHDGDIVIAFYIYCNGQDLMLHLCKNLAVVLEMIMTLAGSKCVELQVQLFVPIQMNASAGIEFI